MTAPMQRVILATHARDGWCCIACGSDTNLTWHPRRPTNATVTPADGVTLCQYCAHETDGDMHELAQHSGWTLRDNLYAMGTVDVPVWDRNTNSWWLLNDAGTRAAINTVEATELIEIAGGYVRKVGT